MSLEFRRYTGFKNAEELIYKLNKLQICDESNITIIETAREFYGVAIESSLKEFIIGKEEAWYIDENGYLENCSLAEFKLPYKIDSYSNKSGSRKIYDEYLASGNNLNVYHVKKGTLKYRRLESEILNQALFLLNTFVDKYYSRDDFNNYDYASDTTVNKIKSYLFENNKLNVVAINPFKNKVKIKLKEEEIDTNYKAVCYRFNNSNRLSIVAYEIRELSKTASVQKKWNFDAKLSDNHIDYSNINSLTKREINKLISKDGHAIKHVDFPTKTMIRIALEYDFSCISEINGLSLEEYIELVEEYPECLNYLGSMSKEIQIKMLEKDIGNIKHLRSINKTILGEFIGKINYNDISDKNIRKEYLDVISRREVDKRIKELQINTNYNLENLREHYIGLIKAVSGNKNHNTQVLNDEYPLHEHMKIIYSLIECSKIQLATGYISDKGIALVKDIIYDKRLSKEIQLIIGEIGKHENVMKINTARHINNLIEYGVKVKTCDERFFHGKSYLFLGKEVSAVIIGSSNLSFSGFFSHIELNAVTIFHNSSEFSKNIIEYYERLWERFKLVENIKGEDMKVIYKEEGSKDEEYKRQFAYLLEENPDKEYKNEIIFSGYSYENDYCGFYFERYGKMLVLESLKYQNAVYVFTNVVKPDEFIKNLMRKDLSTKLNEYCKRFNHSTNGSYIIEIKELMHNNIQTK